MSDTEIDSILTKIEAVPISTLTPHESTDVELIELPLPDYLRNVVRDIVAEVHEAIRAQDFPRAHERLDDLLFVFVGHTQNMSRVRS